MAFGIESAKGHDDANSTPQVIWRKCGMAASEVAMARNTIRGKPAYTLCKLCVSEQAKLSFREKRFPGYLKRVRNWADVSLLSEEAWLEAKLEAVRAELRFRSKL